MNKIKTVEGLKPWQVMKRAEEGEPVARRLKADDELKRINLPLWDWSYAEYFIIDTTTPEFPWDEFDYPFFNQYGGLPVIFLKANGFARNAIIANGCELRESPYYPWAGGEQPVPDRVEVEVDIVEFTLLVEVGIVRRKLTMQASDVDWARLAIVGFKLTGRVL